MNHDNHPKRPLGIRTSLIVLLFLSALVLAIAAPSALAAGPPIITKTAVSPVTETTATLKATINPDGKKTEYHFEYLTDAAYQANPEGERFAGATAAPFPDAKLPEGEAPVPVTEQIAELTAATTYHFRLIATNKFNGSSLTTGPERTFTTFAPPPLFGSCANDLFRIENPAAALIEHPSSELPDCRAYEQASPTNKNGGDVTATVPYAKAAANGGGITFISKSGIPGGEGAQEFPSYLASRGEGEAGWSTHGLLPPADEGQQAQLLGWTPDFTEVFTKATRFGNPSETELLARPGSGGPPTVVAPYTPNLEPKFLATAADGSLLFESPVKLLEGAVPGHPNVYLWQHGNGELALAGVLNDGKAPLNGAIGGPYDWIRGTNSATLSEGGGKRDYYTEQEHALAKDGSAAFFTAAGSGRLYERINPAQPQSALNGGEECTEAAKACTLEVSASHKTDGKGPGGAELGSPRPAAFQAASTNGEVSYFTSEEELSEESNTGPEPSELHAEPFVPRAKLGPTKAEEIEHECIPARASGLATDETYVYWADPEAGTIGRARLDCSEYDPTFITGASGINDLAVDAGHVYWTEPGNNAIGRATIAGAEVKPDFITGLNDPDGIAVGGGRLYWTSPAGHAMGRANADGSEVEQEFIKFEEAGLKVPTQGVAVDPAGGHIYVAFKGGFIQSYELDDKKDPGRIEITELAGDIDLALDGSHLYWSYEETAGLNESLISRAKLDLSDVEEYFVKQGEGVERAQGVAVQGEHIYWANDPSPSSKPGNDLYRYEAASGKLEDLTTDPGATNGAEVKGVLGASADGSVAYFAANGDLDGPGGAEAGNCKGRFGSMSGQCNLYRWEAGGGEPSFVARLGVGGSEGITDAADWGGDDVGAVGVQCQLPKDRTGQRRR